MIGIVEALSIDDLHRFSKKSLPHVTVVAGLGTEGDAHQGVTVRHRSRVAIDPNQPNLRQVHLIQAELFAELALKGFRVGSSDLGENITTLGIDLLSLPKGTLLRLGETVVLEVTGLRNPCAQIERFQPGLLAAVVSVDRNGDVVRKAGIMSIVRVGGVVRVDDRIDVELPPLPHERLERV